MYVAEDGTRVPPAPEEYGPRRLARYRRAHLAEAREEPPLHTQGVPIVPVHEPPPEVLEIQRKFEALSASLEEHGAIEQLDEDAEFDAFIAADSSAVKFQEEDVLNAVQRHILGESGSVADTPTLSINPAHLSGFSSTDIKRDYDEHVLGPVTMGVPVVIGAPRAAKPEPQETVTEPTPDSSPSEAEASAPVAGDQEQATEDVSTGDEAEALDAKPVRAMDAHGLDLSGMDRKAPKSGGRIALISILLILLIAAVVLGIIFLI